MRTTQVQIGLLTIAINQQSRCDRDFLDGLEDGMTGYCECGSKHRTMTVEEVVKLMQGIARNTDACTGESFPRVWVSGFVLGWVTGLNNPDIAHDDPCLSYTQSLVRKHTPLYRELVIQTERSAREERPDTEPLPFR